MDFNPITYPKMFEDLIVLRPDVLVEIGYNHLKKRVKKEFHTMKRRINPIINIIFGNTNFAKF